MTIRIFISALSGNYEVKKRQQRIQTVLDSCAIAYELVDITEAGREEDRKFMQETAKAKDGDRNPLPPQIYNNQDYCGDYDGFDFSNETDQLHVFLKLSEGEVNTAKDILSANRRSSSKEPSPERHNGVDSVAEPSAEEGPPATAGDADAAADVWGGGSDRETSPVHAASADEHEVAEQQEGASVEAEVPDEAEAAAESLNEEAPEPEVKELAPPPATEPEPPAEQEQPAAEQENEESEYETESEEESSGQENPDVTELKAAAHRLEGQMDFWSVLDSVDETGKDATEDSTPNFWDAIDADEDRLGKRPAAEKMEQEVSVNFWDDIGDSDDMPRKKNEVMVKDAEEEAANFWDEIGDTDEMPRKKTEAQDLPHGSEEEASAEKETANFWDEMGDADEMPGKKTQDLAQDPEEENTAEKETANFWDEMGDADEMPRKKTQDLAQDPEEENTAEKETANFWDEMGDADEMPRKKTQDLAQDPEEENTAEKETANFWDEMGDADEMPRKKTQDLAQDPEEENTEEKETANFWDEMGDADEMSRKKTQDLAQDPEGEATIFRDEVGDSGDMPAEKAHDVPESSEEEKADFWNDIGDTDERSRKVSQDLVDDSGKVASVRSAEDTDGSRKPEEEATNFWDGIGGSDDGPRERPQASVGDPEEEAINGCNNDDKTDTALGEETEGDNPNFRAGLEDAIGDRTNPPVEEKQDEIISVDDTIAGNDAEQENAASVGDDHVLKEQSAKLQDAVDEVASLERAELSEDGGVKREGTSRVESISADSRELEDATERYEGRDAAHTGDVVGGDAGKLRKLPEDATPEGDVSEDRSEVTDLKAYDDRGVTNGTASPATAEAIRSASDQTSEVEVIPDPSPAVDSGVTPSLELPVSAQSIGKGDNEPEHAEKEDD